MVTASLEEHLGQNLRSLVLDTKIDGETEFGSVRSASVLIFGGAIGAGVGEGEVPGRFGVLSSKVMVAQQGAQLLSNTLRIVEMKTTGEEFDLMPTTVRAISSSFLATCEQFKTKSRLISARACRFMHELLIESSLSRLTFEVESGRRLMIFTAAGRSLTRSYASRRRSLSWRRNLRGRRVRRRAL